MQSLDPKVYQQLKDPSPVVKYYFLINPTKPTTKEGN
tara:strand:- start:267 stop:377 length:111 start_codon:yes stop_codon:yes gene_type:complete